MHCVQLTLGVLYKITASSVLMISARVINSIFASEYCASAVKEQQRTNKKRGHQEDIKRDIKRQWSISNFC